MLRPWVRHPLAHHNQQLPCRSEQSLQTRRHTAACQAATCQRRLRTAHLNDWNGLAVTAVAVMLSPKPGVAGSHFTFFGSCDFNLDPMTIYKLLLGLYPLKRPHTQPDVTERITTESRSSLEGGNN